MNELATIKEISLDDIRKGIELPSNEFNIIAGGYVPFIEELKDYQIKLNELEIGNAQHCETANRLKLDLGKFCSRLAAKKKDDKNDVLLKGRAIDGIYNAIEANARWIQSDADKISKYYILLEEKRKSELKEQRIKDIRDYVEDITMLDNLGLEDLTEEAFTTLVLGYKARWEAKIEGERIRKEQEEKEERRKKLELERKNELIALGILNFVDSEIVNNVHEYNDDEYKAFVKTAQLKKQDFEKEELERTKIEQERIAKLKAEEEKLAKERADMEKAEAEKLAKRQSRAASISKYISFINDYEAMISLEDKVFDKELAKIVKIAEAKWEEERKNKEAQEKLQLQLKAQKEEEERKERERLELSKKSELERLLAYINTFQQTQAEPQLKNKSLEDALKEINAKFEGFKLWAKKLAQQSS